MNYYELTLILNPDLASKFDPYKEHFESVLSQLGFNIHYCENVGIRELAYTIGINKKGHYLIYQLDGDPANINELETKIKYDNSVIQHLRLRESFQQYSLQMKFFPYWVFLQLLSSHLFEVLVCPC